MKDQTNAERIERLRAAIADLSDEHLTCRDIGHRWRIAAYRRAEGGDIVRTLACRCGTARTETFAPGGEMVRRSYRYVDGYRFPKGTVGQGGLPKLHFRREWVLRKSQSGGAK